MRKSYYLIVLIFLFIAGVTSTAAVDSDSQAAAPLLDRIAIGEGTTDAAAQEHGLASAYDITFAYGNYNPADSKPLTGMKISEVKQLQQQMLANGAESSAVGKYQLLRTTLEGQQNTLGLSEDTVFDAATQDLFGLSLLERRDFNEWLDGKISDDQFQKNLAYEWSSVANPNTGLSSYRNNGELAQPGDVEGSGPTNLQHARTTDAQIKEAMAQTKSLACARILQDSLTQLRQNGEVISSSGKIIDRNVAFSAKLNNPNGKKVKLQVELRRLDEYDGNFIDSEGHESDFKNSELVTSGSEATAYAYGLIDGDYHWRARAVSEDGTAGEWVDFGANPLSGADFTILEAVAKSQTSKLSSNGDNIPPTVNLVLVKPSSLVYGMLCKTEDFTIDYTVSDSGGSGLKQVELWRKDGTGSWKEIARNDLGGCSHISGSFKDHPLKSGSYQYGIHVIDNAGNFNDEQNNNTKNQPEDFGPIQVNVEEARYEIIPDGLRYGMSYEKPIEGDLIQVGFDFDSWGYYGAMILQGKKYFTNYSNIDDGWSPPYLYKISENADITPGEQFFEVLLDDDNEVYITSSSPLKLKDGYELAIKSYDLDSEKLSLELTKDKEIVDNKVISPSIDGATIKDKTYYYIGNKNGLVTIAVYFKNVFRSSYKTIATIDGIWQISNNPSELDTKINDIKSSDLTELPLYYEETIYSDESDKVSLDTSNFEDFRNDLVREQFNFDTWGSYEMANFEGRNFFAGYVEDENGNADSQFLFTRSLDESPWQDGQLEEILLDDRTEKSVTSSVSFELKEGYELKIASIDLNIDNKWEIYLLLSKDGVVVDSKTISPPKPHATVMDKTYYFRKNVGNSRGLVIIAVHFKDAVRELSGVKATIDGVWQISENPKTIK